MRSSAGKSSNPYTAVSTTAASTAFGRFSKQPGQEEQAQRERDRGKDQRERRARARLVVHRRLRQPAGDGIAVSQRRREIGRADAEKLLPGVQSISVLRSEGAGGRYAFDIGQQQAAGGQRNNSLDIAQPQRRACQGGQARRNFSCRRHPERRKPKQRCSNDRQRDNAERDRLSGQQAFAEHEQPDRDDADGENEEVRLAELPGKQQDPLEKIVPAARHAEQARQLGHGDGQSRAGLEAHEDAVADQLHQHAQPQQPGDQAKRRHREGCEAGDLRVTLRVALRHRPHRSGNHQRDGGGRPDRQLTRRSEQGVAQTAQQIAVDADLRRQACKPGIGERNRDRVGRQGYAGDDIAGQPGSSVFSQPTGRRKPPEPSCSFPGLSSNPPCGARA